MKSLFDYYDGAEERCGFILNSGEIVELENTHPEPTQGFEIDPREILRYMPELAGIWHTHPESTSVLSGEDKQCMLMWPEALHYVVGKDGIRTYKVTDEVVIDEDFLPR